MDVVTGKGKQLCYTAPGWKRLFVLSIVITIMIVSLLDFTGSNYSVGQSSDAERPTAQNAVALSTASAQPEGQPFENSGGGNIPAFSNSSFWLRWRGALDSSRHPLPFRQDGCTTFAKHVVVDTDLGLFFPAYSSSSTVKIPVCSIAAVKPHQYEYPTSLAKPMAADYHQCSPLALIAQIERPQHAAHCMWSLVSVLAAQMEAHLDYRTTPAHLTILSYGSFESWADYSNRAKYPHIELLQVLSRAYVTVYRDQNGRRIMIAPVRGDPGAVGRDGRSTTFCYQIAVLGNVPLRIPRVSVKTELTPKHFIELRRRIIEHFALTELSDSARKADPYMLLVSRVKRKRRLILNKDELAEAVRRAIGGRVVEVDWEGMSLREQLQLAINAGGMIGTHGNGMAWAPLMPQGSAMVELGSKWHKRNEVKPGRNVANSANIAEWCGLQALSIRCDFVENNYSKRTSPTRVWKEVDITVSRTQMQEITAFLAPWALH